MPFVTAPDESCLQTGRPLASDRFISKVEVALGRRLRTQPVGRPQKKERKR